MAGPYKSDADESFKIRLGGGSRGEGGATGRATSGLLGGKLTARLTRKGGFSGAGKSGGVSKSDGGFSGDSRQRVVVKISYRNHGPKGGGGSGGGSGGGGKLVAHGQYLERDGAAREGERGHFYDRADDDVEHARERLQDWSRDDPRHFRIMLAPESGGRLALEPGGLMDFTRDTMDGMERDLGVRLDWMAVDHHNTYNPHVHVIVRGLREDGVELRLPREYIGHGLRETARDMATERVGERSIADERLRLEREIGSPSLNRLDLAIEDRLSERREVLIQELGKDCTPDFGGALKARARELERMGLATEVRRNVLAFEKDWKERLEAARNLDVVRELRTARLYEPRMGRVLGEVQELGPRGENPDRGLLILDTPEHGRVLLNTSREAIQDLQRGSIVSLEPEGKRASIERVAFHSVSQQVHARADTELDRELDRIARGQDRQLPELPNIERCLAERAFHHLENDLGEIDRNGNFAFKDGVRQKLHELERSEAGRALAAERGKGYHDTPRFMDDRWTVRGEKELFCGKAAMLERVGDVALVPLAKGQELYIGQELSLKFSRSPELGLQQTLQATKHLARGLELGR